MNIGEAERHFGSAVEYGRTGWKVQGMMVVREECVLGSCYAQGHVIYNKQRLTVSKGA